MALKFCTHPNKAHSPYSRSCSSFSESQQSSSTGTNAIALYTDDDCSLSGGASAVSSRMASARSASARSLFAPQPRLASPHDLDGDFMQQQCTDALPGSDFREAPDGKEVDGMEVDGKEVDGMEGSAQGAQAAVKRSNLLPIRSSLAALQSRTSPQRRFAAAHAYKYGHGRRKQDVTQTDGGHCSKTFRKLAVNAATLNDAELDKQLVDAGLGDGLQSARRHAESSAKRIAPAINLTIRLSNDYASLKALGCSEGMLSQLRSIDPPKEEVEIVAEKVETGDMTLLCAPPDARLQPIPARCFAPHRRQSSPSQSTGTRYPQLPTTSAHFAIPSLLKQRPPQRAASGSSPLPPHADWIVEGRSSPLRFSAMSSPVPRFQQATRAAEQGASEPGVTDWANALQESSYSYHSVFSGPPRFPDVRRDVVTPPPLHAAVGVQLHNRRSCTAQHKQEREPTSMLEYRISAALAKEAQPPTTTERMGLKSVQERAAALEVDMIGRHYGAKDHERIKTKQERLMQVEQLVKCCTYFCCFCLTLFTAVGGFANELECADRTRELAGDVPRAREAAKSAALHVVNNGACQLPAADIPVIITALMPVQTGSGRRLFVTSCF
jgi:hypothetical protein